MGFTPESTSSTGNFNKFAAPSRLRRFDAQIYSNFQAVLRLDLLCPRPESFSMDLPSICFTTFDFSQERFYAFPTAFWPSFWLFLDTFSSRDVLAFSTNSLVCEIFSENFSFFILFFWNLSLLFIYLLKNKEF